MRLRGYVACFIHYKLIKIQISVKATRVCESIDVL